MNELRKKITKALWDHEYGYTMDDQDALESLGLIKSEMSTEDLDVLENAKNEVYQKSACNQ